MAINNHKMKRLYIIAVIALLSCFTVACNKDFLDRSSKDKINAELFFNTAADLEVYTNGFYNIIPTESLYQSADDDVVPGVADDRIKGTRIVPTASGSGGWSWSNLRSINYFLENYYKCPDINARLKYGGVARFFRAMFYFDKVKRFGDVPWYNKVLEAGDPELYKKRDSRKLVMDSVLADIDYAIANIPREVQLNKVTKYTALILKARICLFEGTFRKYHELGDHEKFLNEAVAASDELINYGVYSIFTTGGPSVAYRELFARNDQTATETILARDYSPDFDRHNTAYLMTATTQGNWGINKDLINSYLMQDGSRFTDLPNYNTMGFYAEMQNRDPRLTQTTAGPGFTVYGAAVKEPVSLNAPSTGYRVIKALPDRGQWSSGSTYNDIIVFRYAEALLILAEAKAELGTLTQIDLNRTINKLRDRVNMPHLNLVNANASPDPYLANMYPNVNSGSNKGVILEIRRERRIELFNEGGRWDDLLRWKEGKKVEKPMLGIYFPGLGAYDFDNDGIMDVYVHNGNTSAAPPGISSFININQRPLSNGASGNLKPISIAFTFDESKDYYYPIPSEDLILNKNLEQNPNW